MHQRPCVLDTNIVSSPHPSHRAKLCASDVNVFIPTPLLQLHITHSVATLVTLHTSPHDRERASYLFFFGQLLRSGRKGERHDIIHVWDLLLHVLPCFQKRLMACCVLHTLKSQRLDRYWQKSYCVSHGCCGSFVHGICASGTSRMATSFASTNSNHHEVDHVDLRKPYHHRWENGTGNLHAQL